MDNIDSFEVNQINPKKMSKNYLTYSNFHQNIANFFHNDLLFVPDIFTLFPMLFKPVYVKESKMQESPTIPCSASKKQSTRHIDTSSDTSSSFSFTLVQQSEQKLEKTEEPSKIPMLVSNPSGLSIVIPKEATRDVMSGKVAYYLVNEKGMTLFEPKHMMVALKLDKQERRRIQDFSCIGAHLRKLPIRPRKIKYRRRYISPELIGNGIYVSTMYL